MADHAHEPPPELLQLAEPSSILRALECPICTNIALPPLILCEHGHYVCESCRALTTRCGLCKGAYTSARNIAIEQIVRASIFTCRFKAEGCIRRVFGDDYKSHLDKCAFRNIICNCYYGNHCQGVSIRFNEYIDHLLEHHKFEKRTYVHAHAESEEVDAHAPEGVTTLDFTSSMRGRVCEWTPLIIEYDNKFFIARRRLLSGILTIWVSLFGACGGSEERDGDGDFHTEITVCNSDPEVLVPRVSWTVAVHPCRKDWAEIDDSFLCVSVPFQQLKQIGSRNRKDGKLAWNVTFKIRPNFPSVQNQNHETLQNAIAMDSAVHESSRGSSPEEENLEELPGTISEAGAGGTRSQTHKSTSTSTSISPSQGHGLEAGESLDLLESSVLRLADVNTNLTSMLEDINKIL